MFPLWSLSLILPTHATYTALFAARSRAPSFSAPDFGRRPPKDDRGQRIFYPKHSNTKKPRSDLGSEKSSRNVVVLSFKGRRALFENREQRKQTGDSRDQVGPSPAAGLLVPRRSLRASNWPWRTIPEFDLTASQRSFEVGGFRCVSKRL